MIATEKAFVEAVRDMRGLQGAYFKSRDPAVLRRAKAAEQRVDQLLAEYERASSLEKQLGLFGSAL